MIYLASPYSSPSKAVIQARYIAAVEYIAWSTLNRTEIIYSPIVHYHTPASHWGLPGDFAFWQRLNFGMLAKADALEILTLDGWAESIGVRAEMEEAARLGLSINFVKPI